MKHPFDVHVGSKLRQCRRSAGMSQQQLADKLGIKAQQIQNFEIGAGRISPNVMRNIVAASVVVVFCLAGGAATYMYVNGMPGWLGSALEGEEAVPEAEDPESAQNSSAENRDTPVRVAQASGGV